MENDKLSHDEQIRVIALKLALSNVPEAAPDAFFDEVDWVVELAAKYYEYITTARVLM